MKGVYFVGITLIVAGMALYIIRETGIIGEMPKLFTAHAVAVSLILAGLVVISTQFAQQRQFIGALK